MLATLLLAFILPNCLHAHNATYPLPRLLMHGLIPPVTRPLFVAQGEANRIKNAVTTEEVPDSGLDPDHPLTCKICLDAVVEVSLMF